ncbi:MAG: leucine-rich repeat domain-containing protein [Clostridia bacterium]|nr:leucine-rich repeat domain-containing protein [Clostridia bacterium]
MKTLKKALAMLMCALLLMSAGALAGWAEPIGVEALTWEQTDDGIVITSCDKTASGSLEIPAVINGLPVIEIASGAFESCEGLTTVSLPDSVKEIGAAAFYNCTRLARVSFGSGVRSIPQSCFQKCTALTQIDFPDNLESIGPWAFPYCIRLTTIVLPETLTELGDMAFAYCASLEAITIPGTVSKIGRGAFTSCASLENVTLSEGVAEVSQQAFCYCAGMKTITIPQSVKTIAVGAFQLTYSQNEINSMQQTYDAAVAAGSTEIDGIPLSIFQKWIDSSAAQLSEVSYQGTQEEWDAITIEEGNDDLLAAEIQCLPKEVTAEDPDTGIVLVYEGEGEFSAEEIAIGAAFDTIKEQTGAQALHVYDLKLLANGAEVQPNGTARISIPLPDGFNSGTVALYYYDEAAGSLEAIDFTIENGILTFETNHFSVYALIDTASILNHAIAIQKYQPTLTVDYKTTVIFKAIVTDASEGAVIQWFVNDEKAEAGETCTVEKAKADYTVQVKLLAADGEVLAESETETVKVNQSFFQKLIAFFKGLFGLLPTITQAFKG